MRERSRAQSSRSITKKYQRKSRETFSFNHKEMPTKTELIEQSTRIDALNVVSAFTDYYHKLLCNYNSFIELYLLKKPDIFKGISAKTKLIEESTRIDALKSYQHLLIIIINSYAITIVSLNYIYYKSLIFSKEYQQKPS